MSALADPLTYAGPFTGKLAKLLVENPASDTHRWEQAKRDAIDFLPTWGTQAAELGWTVEELFGLDPVAPLARHDVMGLIWLLSGKKVTGLVRRQGFWDNRRRELTEALVHQVCHIRPLHLDEASGAV